MRGTFQFLGTGASAGVPMIGCSCSVCRSNEIQRLRSSARIRICDTEIIIDITPDFRQQALLYSINKPDAILLSHTHYDHMGGMEELRAYSVHKKGPIDCFLSSSSLENIQKLLYYHFTPKGPDESFSAQYSFHQLQKDSGVFSVKGIPIDYCTYYQGNMPVTGFRIGSLAYITDIKQYDETVVEMVRGVDTLVVSLSLSSRMQFTVEEMLTFCAKVKAKKIYCTHLSHEMSADIEGVILGYDGLTLNFDVEC